MDAGRSDNPNDRPIECAEHLGLLYKVASRIYARWKPSGVEHADLTQALYLFMDRCAQRYDPARINPRSGKPYRWSTYFVAAAMKSQSSLVEQALGYRRSKGQANMKLGRAMVRVDAPGRGGHPLRERLEARDPAGRGEREAAEAREGVMNAAREMDAVVALLSETQRGVYQLRLVRGCTLAETGRRLGLSRERVRQVQAEVLRAIHAAVEAGRCPHARQWAQEMVRTN